jgi:CRISPR-associated protein Csm3
MIRLKMLFEGMCLLEDDYIGASGTRGYGKIKFKDLEFKKKTKKDYQEGGDWGDVEGAKDLKTPGKILNWLKNQSRKEG